MYLYHKQSYNIAMDVMVYYLRTTDCIVDIWVVYIGDVMDMFYGIVMVVPITTGVILDIYIVVVMGILYGFVDAMGHHSLYYLDYLYCCCDGYIVGYLSYHFFFCLPCHRLARKHILSNPQHNTSQNISVLCVFVGLQGKN